MNIQVKFDHQTVALADISSEETPFRITTKSTVDDLTEAFNRVGLINPPVLCPRKNHYVVVCGHRRVTASRALKLETVPARILISSNDPLVCAYLAISENSVERPLNLIETSRALSLLKSIIPDEKKRYGIAANLGLPSNPSLSSKIESLCDFPESIQNGILSGAIALPSALMLSRFVPETADLLAELLLNLKLSLSRQKELIVLIDEICIRDGCDIRGLIQSGEIHDILNHPEMDLPRKAGLIRDNLKRRRFPHISRAMDSFEHLRKRLALGENVSLKPPPGFESRQYNITFSFSELSELIRHRQTLDRLVRDDRTRELFDPDHRKTT